MAWPKTLVLVRHAESVGNTLSADERADYDLSTHSYPLTARGREQAKITGEYLKSHYGSFDAYYVSYYRRSWETMEIMYPDAKKYEDPRLAEAQRGIWHTLNRSEIDKYMPWEAKRKAREGYYHYRPPGGENWPDVELRIHSFLGTLNRDYGDKNVLIVVHGHWLVLFQRLIHHFSIDEAMKRASDVYDNASITHYYCVENSLRLSFSNFCVYNK